MLRLRPFKISDIKYLLDWASDERTFTAWCANKFTYPLTKKQLMEYKETYDQDEFGWSFTAVADSGIPVEKVMARKW